MNKRKWDGKAVFLVAAAAALAASAAFGAASIAPLEYSQSDGQGLLKITGDGEFSYTQEENTADKQVIFELKGATLAKGADRKLDASSFPGNVKMVSAYKADAPETVRVVVQLNEAGQVEAEQVGNTLTVKVPKAGGATAAVEPVPGAASASVVPEPVASPAPDKTRLTEFMETKETRRFTGKPITIQVRDAPVGDVLRLVGEASGFNIVLGEDVKGTITLSLVDVPWDQVLDVVLHTRQLGAERNNNILRVVSLSALRAEKEAELATKRSAEAVSPRVTRVFPISYAKPADIQTVLSRFGSAAGTSGNDSNANAASTSTQVSVDERTNSLIVRDTPENIERMKKLIEILDTQTPQILIEGKIVDASENFSKSINGSFGVSRTPDSPQFFAAFNGGTTDALLGDAGEITGSVGQANFGFSPSLGFLGSGRLNALLNIGESEGQTKVVASPRLVVRNGFAASIRQTTPVAVPAPPSGGLGATIQQFQIANAELSLAVTPTVANDGNVRLNIQMTRGGSENAGNGLTGVASKTVNTEVYVESGSTLVIGGIYTMTTTHGEAGIPGLRKIPIIGWLFGSEDDVTARSELFIFITPKILNEKESGLTS